MNAPPDLILLCTPASPFARKVRAMALLRGVSIDLRITPVDPLTTNADVAEFNPLGRLPVLLTPDGALYDSRVITRYLEEAGATMAGPCWQQLVAEAIADGIMEFALAMRIELAARPAALRWHELTQARFERISATLDKVQTLIGDLEGLNIGSVSLTVALEYLDLRHPDYDWRTSRPALAGWLEAIAEAKPLRATRPPD